jgi:Na+-driven multidrug efflux pump
VPTSHPHVICVSFLNHSCVTLLQGVFRGLKDAATPLWATLAVNAVNIALEPLFIFHPLHLGVAGSAAATVLAQAAPAAALAVVLVRRRLLLAAARPEWGSLRAMAAPTGWLLLRTASISAVFAAATALVARAGPLAAAAHQVC